jgi:hypothetical protein
LLDLSEVLEILDPSVSETGLPSFAGFGPTEQIVALHIGRKPDCTVWQTRTSGVSKKSNFPQFDQKPDACATNHSLLYSHLWKNDV